MCYHSPSRSTRGSAIVSVVVFTTVALLLVGSLLSWGVTERRLNYRHALRLEARNAAEALAEYGFSQIREKMETKSTVTLSPSGTDALVLPPTSVWSGSQVNTAANELIGGKVDLVPSSGASYYFNPGDPNNEKDPLKGKHVFRRDIRVIAKATVTPASGRGGSITSYVTQRISVRGAPLFAHAIFYNMDLEIFNGPDMTISGPVHTNGNLYLYPDKKLTFTDQVTATGRVYHAAKPGDTSTDGGSAAGRTGDVRFPNKSGTPTSLRDSDNIWKDSTQGAGTAAIDWSGFRDHASQRWNGNLQTVAHSVNNYTPVAIGKYIEDPTPNDGADNSVNSGRTIIEPPVALDTTASDYGVRREVEEQKYSSNAGLYITVNPATQTITLSSRDKDVSIKNKALTLPAGNSLVTYKPYNATATQTVTSVVKTHIIDEVGTGGNLGKFRYKPVTTTTVSPAKITYTSAGSSTVTEAPTSSDIVTGAKINQWRTTPPAGSNTSSSSTPVMTLTSGMYDRHRQKGTDLVELDMSALKKAVAAMAGVATTTVVDGTGTKTVTVDPVTDQIGNLDKEDWTGVVYIEVLGGPTTDPITGATIPATIPNSMQTSVRIINGGTSVPSYVGDNSSEGLTIATNAPVYIKGDFNADGTTSTSSPNSATTPEAGELPAAIIGDAITILSQDFSDTKTGLNSIPEATTSTIEVAAALLTGLTPTNKDGTGRTSGGAHNLPRFLEDWGDARSVFIRGSLVSLFESRVFTEPHGITSYYTPPSRRWGFNTMFRDGRYPPGTPRVMSYRRVDFTDMTAAEYEAAKASFDW